MSLTIPVNQRIEVIDVLRGFALLGIILVHMVEQYYAGPMPEAITKVTPSHLVDNIFSGIVAVLVMGKFYMIFSFLFGLSFFIQSSKGEGNDNFLLRFTWRLVLLFAIGMLHHIHYRGDILGIYAILGLGLLLFHRASDKVLLVTGLILVFNIPSLLLRSLGGIFQVGDNPFGPQDQSALMSHYETIKSGTYLAILKSNLSDFPGKLSFQLFSGRIFITFGLFLLGFYAGRKRIFQQLDEKKAWIKKLLNYSWKSLIVVALIMGGFFGGMALLKLQVPSYVQFAIGGFGYDVFNVCMSLIYLGGVILLFQKQRWQSFLMNFYEVGRMGLTTYLVQSFFGFFIFTGMGLGLLNEFGSATWFFAALVLFVVQIVISKAWFRYFNYGFFEWAWRSLTYFETQQLVRQRKVAVPAN